jgi:hypothetical protein
LHRKYPWGAAQKPIEKKGTREDAEEKSGSRRPEGDDGGDVSWGPVFFDVGFNSLGS